MSESELKTKDLTPRVVIMIILCGAVVTPVMIYYQLVYWLFLPFSVWVLLIVFAEITNLYQKPLSPQEAFLITSIAPISMLGFAGFGGAFYFLNLIYNNYYFANSPLLNEYGFASGIPSWYRVPSTFSGRTFLNDVWILPIVISITSFLLQITVMITTGLIAYRMEERLDFPIQGAMAEGIFALVESHTSRRKKILYASAFVGALPAMIVYLFPSLFPSLFPWRIYYSGFGQFVTIPWIDLNRNLEMLHLNGASLAFPIDPLAYAMGLVIPFSVASLMLLGNLAFYFIGNLLLVKYGLWTSGIGAWQPGSDTIYNFFWSQLRFWNSVMIGLGFSLIVFPFLKNINRILDFFRSKSSSRKLSNIKYYSKLLIIYFIASSCQVVFVHLLLPSYPLWVLIFFNLLWPLFGTIISTRVAGVTSAGFNIPMLNETISVAVGYKNLDAFIVSGSVLQMNNVLGSAFASTLKQAHITGTNVKSYIKAFLIASALSFFFGFLYTEFFWRIASIPSSVFPATVQQWPISVMFRCLQIKYIMEGLIIRLNWILASFLIGGLIYLASAFASLEFLLPSMMGGFASPPPMTLGIFIGSLIGKFIMSRAVGEKWDQYKSVVLTGFSIGNSITLTLTASYLIVRYALLAVPY